MQVYILIRRSSDVERFKKLGVIPIVSSFADLHHHQTVLHTCDYVFHIAANASFRTRGEYQQSNVESTQILLNLLQGSQKLKRFIFTSTVGAVDRPLLDACLVPMSKDSKTVPTSPYGRSKLAAEQLVQQSGLPNIILRLPWVYGPGMRPDSHIATFLKLGLTAHPLSRLFLTGRASVIYIEDLITFCSLLTKTEIAGNPVLYPSNPNPIAIGDIFKFGLKNGNQSQFQISTHVLKVISSFIPTPFAAKVLLQDAMVTVSDLAALKYSAETPHLEGLHRTLAYLTAEKSFHIITGAASGLGKAFAEQLHREGRQLLLVDNNAATLEAVGKDLGQSILCCDLTTEMGTAALHTFISDNSIAGIILSAGIGIRSEFISANNAANEKLIALNIRSIVTTSQAALKRFKQTTNAGYVMFIASSVAETPTPGMALYGASKAFVLSLGRSLFGEYLGTNIKILTVCPAGVKTNFQQNAGVKVNNHGDGLLAPETVVTAALAALQRGAPEVWIGWKSRLVSYVISKLPPKLAIQVWAKLFAALR